MDENKSAHLSRAILDMKFMKKSKERVEKATEDAEGQAMYANEISEDMKKSGQNIFVDTSIVHCKNLIDGRFSFGGMNPDVEKLMNNNYGKRSDCKQNENEINDVEMAQGYSTLVNTMGKKFNMSRALEGRMLLTPARNFALRITVAQQQMTKSKGDKLVFPTAFLLAGIGVGVSSFSLKQLMSNPKHH